MEYHQKVHRHKFPTDYQCMDIRPRNIRTPHTRRTHAPIRILGKDRNAHVRRPDQGPIRMGLGRSRNRARRVTPPPAYSGRISAPGPVAHRERHEHRAVPIESSWMNGAQLPPIRCGAELWLLRVVATIPGTSNLTGRGSM
ncbi:hypothetical protein AG1IA_08786 [Rhizoctonia solani AG-1 IA]|uniref:Uncharacterized protein n=1 Tax=Thanatephorus cucumeris (strain AG1-IA) TaxID=983506 RepID=L8WLG7_THACA|nr:hypothetical protein AG1IA_08786 [Rhizoctonia solani AG-1 IA]